MEFFSHLFNAYQGLIQDYGLIGIAIAVGVENLGMPFPTEPAYLVGQLLISQGRATVFEVLLALYIGHAAGSLISYVAGRRIAKVVKKKKRFTDTQKKLAEWYEKYGVATVFATRLMGYVRPWSSYMAGIAEVKFWPFFILSSLGTLILNAICLYFVKYLVFFWVEYPAARVVISASLSVGLFLLLYGVYQRRRLARA